MDNQMNRQMLEHFEIANGEHDQEIGKITNINTMRGIENGSLHFITVPRDQEYIDHSLLNPEYIAHFPNGFIVDFIPNGDGEQQTQQIIADAVNADLAFQGGGNGTDDQDRRLTAALLQLVNKPCHIKIGNETQVIVANKDLTLSGHDKTEPISHHNFSTVSNQHSQVLQTESISDTHFKIYQQQKPTHVQTPSQANPPLPPLTPIRRLTRQRKNSVANAPSDIQIFQVNEINVDEEIDSRQRPLTKKSLPHKKRISKKLRNIDRVEVAPPPIRQTVIYQDIQQNQIQEVENQFMPPQQQFSCQLCAIVCTSQLEFFAHLKSHYEPQSVVTNVSSLPTKESINTEESLVLNHSNETDNIEFTDFPKSTMDDKLEQQDEVALKNHNVQDCSQDMASHRDELRIDEVEFSDTEDMLEGIRGVVDKVQESVGNDSNDEHDWYSSNSLNGNIVYKSDENNQNLNSSVDNFSMFFKNNLDKSGENQEIILPVEDNVQKLTSNATHILPQEAYEVAEEATTMVDDQDKIRTESEIDTILIETHSMEDNNQKLLPKRTHRVRKPKPKPKPIDDEFSESDLLDDDGLSGDDDEKYKKQRRKCTQCDKVFNSSNAFKYHELSHTGERPHQCDICGKSFFAQSALKVHMRLHSGAKPYECEICKRAFRQWGDLKYHTISIHTNERNFQCEFCGKAFARRYSLVIHRRIHTSERNYKCEFCPKSFRASSYLQNHRKVHTGEKPYACSICGKKFRVSGDLKRHTNIHGREKKKKGGEGATVSSSKTDISKKVILKPTNEQIIQFMPKPSTSSSVDMHQIKAEPNILMGLSLLHDELNPTTHQPLVKIEQAVQASGAANNGTIIYSDGAVEIFKTEVVDRY